MSNPNPVLNITTDKMRKFQIRIVNTGDHYGLNDVLVNDDDALVEFWDHTTFEDEGQFVSRYFVSTIVDHTMGSGLNLDGGIPEWSIDGISMDNVVNWLNVVMGEL